MNDYKEGTKFVCVCVCVCVCYVFCEQQSINK